MIAHRRITLLGCLIRCQGRSFACAFLLGTAPNIKIQLHIDLLFPLKAVDVVRQGHTTSDSRLNRLRTVA